ncbi:MAG: SDR family oxidoreductase [Opitutaceae bacterium]|nr:SDR family oxidoreductase [Opitutaceae bacterium]
MIAITAATGQFGQLAVEQLLEKVPATQVVAVVRDPAKASALAARGVAVRTASYDDPAALQAAFAGVEKVLLISGTDFGRRAQQHANVIDAARRAGARLIVYTSLLRADTTPLNLGPEHAATEATLKTSSVPFVILRNGWYHENYTASVPAALAHNAFVGSAGHGRIASAARADYAAAAVVALTDGAKVGSTYELAGDAAYTLVEFAAELSRQTGKPIPYVDLPEAEYAGILLKAGLPPPLAQGLASWDVGAAQGALLDEGRALSRLIGRPTTPIADAIARALHAH